MVRRKLALAAAAGWLFVASGAWAEQVRTDLTSFAEVPTIATLASGSFRAMIRPNADRIDYELSYQDLTDVVQQAHIHLGTAGTIGGIITFLCTNRENEPMVSDPAPACPGPTSGTVSGTILPGDIIGPIGQNLNPGEFDKLVAALRNGGAYVNVHTAANPAGEIRGQVR
ncbi:CHRD domain-containing protein [Ferruginivarius sediminum]|uniref:CHRD domain-containing protein n=1 Tax=Ferruginivarius sediminum TaxID=2661937 RepID=A0A369TCH4_9PROT|nr:CHRD domain-containing protein [Ferruginivarius sediminum]RDD61867.1 CHRD domain-containing protein [Ferruginivarius sediminum]